MHLTLNKASKCVMARIRRQGKLYQANFTLREHGNWKTARAVAERWVNSLIRNLPPPMTSKDRQTSRNKSGVVGVYRHREVHRKRNGRKAVYYSWVARWPGCPYRGGVKWPVKRFGEDDAFVLAVLCRRLETESRSRVTDWLENIRDNQEYIELLSLRKV